MENFYYKGARLDGWDFYTGKTINFRESIGKTVKVPSQRAYEEPLKLCNESVLHASREAVGVFQGCKIPLSLYRVEGKPVIEDETKSGFKEFKVIEEIEESKFDDLFGFKYAEVVKNPLDPRKIKAPTDITKDEIAPLRHWASVRDSVLDSVLVSAWASVRASVRDSVLDSVWTSVRASAWASVWTSVWASVWTSVRDSVWASVWDSVWASVWDSEAAYIGSLFPNVKVWKYAEKITPKPKPGEYPFQSCVDLLKRGLVPSYEENTTTWRLHAGPKMEVVFAISKEELLLRTKGAKEEAVTAE